MTGIKKKIICLIIALSAVIAGLAIGSGMLPCGTLTAAAAQDIEGITESVTEARNWAVLGELVEEEQA